MIDEKFAQLPVRLLLHAHLAKNQKQKINIIYFRYDTYFIFVFIIKLNSVGHC
jgi:hypothetical protein